MAAYAMKQDIEPAEVDARELKIKKMNWLVIFPAIMDEIETATSAMKTDYPQVDFHTEVDKANRCIQLSTVNPAEDDIVAGETESDIPSETIALYPVSVTISQGDLGYVAIVMRSGLLDSDGNSENLIVWHVYDSPTKVSKLTIKLAIKDFMTYVRVLNSGIKNSYLDKKRIDYIKFRSRRYTEDDFDPVKSILGECMLKSFWVVSAIGAGLYVILRNIYGY